MDGAITELETLIEALDNNDKKALTLALTLVVELHAEQTKLKMKIKQLEQ